MRTLLAMACVLAVSCGKPGGNDGGTGGGSGGVTGGGAGGGSGGGGGASTSTFTLKVVDPGGAPLAGVGARIENVDSPWKYAEGVTGADGMVTLTGEILNPFNLTVAKAGYGALSIIHLANAVPPQVRLDPLDLSAKSVKTISGAITGAPAGDSVVVDSFDFETAYATAPNYATTYLGSSALPLPLVALHLDTNFAIQNWAVVEGTARGQDLTVPIAFPTPAATVTSATWSGFADGTGLLATANHADMSGLYQTADGFIVTGYGSFQATPMGNQVALQGTFTGVTGPYAPNRLEVDITDQATFTTHYFQGGDLTQNFTVSVLSAQSLASTGGSLGELAATADAPGFDTFALLVGSTSRSTYSWRAYTATGAPFTIKRLPALPSGLTPSDIGYTADLEATAMTIKFADAGARPWTLSNHTNGLPEYQQLFATTPRAITADWRLEPVEPHDQTYAFKVVTPTGAAFPNAAVRIELQSDETKFVEGRTANDGTISLTLAITGPVNLTVVGANYGAVSYLGLTDDLPTEVRLDPLSSNAETIGDLSITLDNYDGGSTLFDAYAAQKVTSISFAQTNYTINSTLPLTIVAIQLTEDGGINNWAVQDGGVRQGMKDVTVSMPDPAQVPTVTSFTASWPSSGLFADPVSVTAYGLHMVGTPTEGFVSAGVAPFSATDAGVISGSFIGITGDLAPNRLVIEVARGVNLLQHFHSGPLTAPMSISIPSAQSIGASGATLGAVSATASGASFHTLELQLSKPGQPKSPWRIYTGPGAPFSVARIPALPYGDAPASLGLGINDQITVVPRLIRFPDAAMRPWQLANSVKPITGYETTVTGPSTNVTGTWR